jgi:hypothetical protein
VMRIASIKREVSGAPRSGKPGSLTAGGDNRYIQSNPLVAGPSYDMAIMTVLPIGWTICRLEFTRLGIKLFSESELT